MYKKIIYYGLQLHCNNRKRFFDILENLRLPITKKKIIISTINKINLEKNEKKNFFNLFNINININKK